MIDAFGIGEAVVTVEFRLGTRRHGDAFKKFGVMREMEFTRKGAGKFARRIVATTTIFCACGWDGDDAMNLNALAKDLVNIGAIKERGKVVNEPQAIAIFKVLNELRNRRGIAENHKGALEGGAMGLTHRAEKG